MDCVFCRINQGEIPAAVIYEDEKTLAFLDVHPIAKGHTIVVPRQHLSDILTADAEMVKNIFGAVQIVAQKISRALRPDGFNIGLNQGEAAGQAVPHLHIHVIPRYKDDGGGSLHSIVHHPPRESLEEIQKEINQN